MTRAGCCPWCGEWRANLYSHLHYVHATTVTGAGLLSYDPNPDTVCVCTRPEADGVGQCERCLRLVLAASYHGGRRPELGERHAPG